jgi:hypothetical protein
MSLAQRLAEASNATSKSLCKIGTILADEKVPAADRTLLKEILDAPEGTPNRLNNAAIAKVLREEGYDLSNSAVDRHRRADCPCNRKVSA